MILEWGLLANMISVIAPMVVVLVTYTKTWSKFDLLIKHLTENVERLQKGVETLSAAQEEMSARLIRVETQLEGLLARMHNVEKSIRPFMQQQA